MSHPGGKEVRAVAQRLMKPELQQEALNTLISVYFDEHSSEAVEKQISASLKSSKLNILKVFMQHFLSNFQSLRIPKLQRILRDSLFREIVREFWLDCLFILFGNENETASINTASQLVEEGDLRYILTFVSEFRSEFKQSVAQNKNLNHVSASLFQMLSQNMLCCTTANATALDTSTALWLEILMTTFDSYKEMFAFLFHELSSSIKHASYEGSIETTVSGSLEILSTDSKQLSMFITHMPNCSRVSLLHSLLLLSASQKDFTSVMKGLVPFILKQAQSCSQAVYMYLFFASVSCLAQLVKDLSSIDEEDRQSISAFIEEAISTFAWIYRTSDFSMFQERQFVLDIIAMIRDVSMDRGKTLYLLLTAIVDARDTLMRRPPFYILRELLSSKEIRLSAGDYRKLVEIVVAVILQCDESQMNAQSFLEMLIIRILDSVSIEDSEGIVADAVVSLLVEGLHVADFSVKLLQITAKRRKGVIEKVISCLRSCKARSNLAKQDIGFAVLQLHKVVSSDIFTQACSSERITPLLGWIQTAYEEVLLANEQRSWFCEALAYHISQITAHSTLVSQVPNTTFLKEQYRLLVSVIERFQFTADKTVMNELQKMLKCFDENQLLEQGCLQEEVREVLQQLLNHANCGLISAGEDVNQILCSLMISKSLLPYSGKLKLIQLEMGNIEELMTSEDSTEALRVICFDLMHASSSFKKETSVALHPLLASNKKREYESGALLTRLSYYGYGDQEERATRLLMLLQHELHSRISMLQQADITEIIDIKYCMVGYLESLRILLSDVPNGQIHHHFGSLFRIIKLISSVCMFRTLIEEALLKANMYACMKEIVNIYHLMITNGEEGLAESIGDFSIELMLDTTHIGVIELAQELLETAVGRLVKEAKQSISSGLPQAVDKWLNQSLPKLSHTYTTTFRKSAGLPYIQAALLRSLAPSYTLSNAEQYLSLISSTGISSNPLLLLNSLNLLASIIQDPKLFQHLGNELAKIHSSESFLEKVMISGMQVYLTNNQWSVKNAALSLFTAVIQRLLKGQYYSTRITEFFTKFPKFLQFIKATFERTINEERIDASELHPLLYCLSLLAPHHHFHPSPISKGLLDSVIICSFSKNYMVRTTAACSLISLVPISSVEDFIESAVIPTIIEFDKLENTNAIHGILCQLYEFLIRYTTTKLRSEREGIPRKNVLSTTTLQRWMRTVAEPLSQVSKRNSNPVFQACIAAKAGEILEILSGKVTA